MYFGSLFADVLRWAARGGVLQLKEAVGRLKLQNAPPSETSSLSLLCFIVLSGELVFARSATLVLGNSNLLPGTYRQ